MTDKGLVFDLSKEKVFRKNSQTLADSLTKRIDFNNVKLTNLLDAVKETVEDPLEAVICMMACISRPESASPQIHKVLGLLDAAVSLKKENEELELVLRNIQRGDTVFYDLSIEDVRKFGL